MVKYLVPILTLVLILTGNLVYAGQTMTLEQCLKTGIESNPSLDAARFGVAAAGYDIKAARADFLPLLSSGYSFNNITSVYAQGPVTETDYLDQDIRIFNIKLTQILYSGSRIVNTYEKAKIHEKLAMAQYALAKLELVYNIESTFYKLMKARQDEIIIKESVNRLDASVKAAQAFFQKELIPYADVLMARVDLADARDQLGIAKNNVSRERAVLLSLMNMQLDTGIEFSGEFRHTLKNIPSFETSLQYAVENRPDIKNLRYQLDIINKEAEIVMGKYLPTIRFDIGYYDQYRDYDEQELSLTESFDRDQTNRYWSAGIYATWDMFDGGKSWYGEKKYNAEAKKIKALIRETKNMISTGIRNALYSMSEAKQRIISSADTLTAATEYYEREEKRLKAGIATIPSLLDAQSRLIRAQGNQIRANLDYQLAKSELEYMTGEKIARMKDAFQGD